MTLRRYVSDLPPRSLAFDAAAAALIAVLCLVAGNARPEKPQPGAFDTWRASAVERLNDVFDPPASHWVAGLLFGDDAGFSDRWKEIFRRTGTAHLTAVSGYNVGLVLMAAQAFLLRLPVGRGTRIAAGLAAVLLFVLVTGRPFSVIRAALMVGAAEAARYAGRPVKPLRAMLLALLVVTIFDPAALVRDRGFQLSLAATFGLATLGPPIRATIFRAWPDPVAEWGSQAVAAGVATAPVIAWMTGSYAPVSFFANVLVAAFIPPLMAAGAALLLLGWLWLGAAQLCAGLLSGLFNAPLILLRQLAELPFAALYGTAAIVSLLAVQASALWLALRWHRAVGRNYLW